MCKQRAPKMTLNKPLAQTTHTPTPITKHNTKAKVKDTNIFTHNHNTHTKSQQPLHTSHIIIKHILINVKCVLVQRV